MSEELAVSAAVLSLLPAQADYDDAESALTLDGWTRAGAGDWAFAMRSPGGSIAARISPFDPTGPYSVTLYRQAAFTGQVPKLFGHRRLRGGGDFQLLEWLEPAPEDQAVAFHRAITQADPEVAELVAVLRQVHDQARRELPWCGPVDTNPSNVMRAADGHLVVADVFYAEGLYEIAWTDPDLVVARIPAAERQFMTEIPTAHSGPWDRASRDQLRELLDAADARQTPRSIRGSREVRESRLYRDGVARTGRTVNPYRSHGGDTNH